MNGVLLAVGVARMAAGAILLLAGVSKLVAGTASFRRVILGYDLVSPGAAAALARLLPALEIGLGSLLVLGLFCGPSSTLALGLLLVFTVAVVASLVRGLRHGCGCGVSGSFELRTVQWTLAYRNLALAAALCASSALHGGWPALDVWLQPGPARLPVEPLVVALPAALWLAAAIAIVALHARQRPPAPLRTAA
jgi:uncharacterized membrane protein YphA (DoxX/SURF4 family)